MPAGDQVDGAAEVLVGLVIVGRPIAAGLQLCDLGLVHAEEEEVVVADEPADLDIGAVIGADGQGAVEGELHVPSAGGLLAGERDLLGQVGRGDEPLGKGDVVVRREGHEEPAFDAGVGVDDLGRGVDQVDRLLGHPVAGGRLGAEDDRARGNRCRVEAAADDAVVERDDVQQLQRLALVLVQALDHDIEQVPLGQGDAVAPLQHAGDPLLVRGLDGAELLSEVLVLGIDLEFLEAVEVGDPADADGVGDQLGQVGVGLAHEAARGDAIGDIGELIRPQPGEVVQHLVAQQLRVQLSNAVDFDAGDGGQVRHPNRALGVVTDDGHSAHPQLIARVGLAHLVEEVLVNAIDDFHMPRQQPLHEADRPDLQCLGQQGVAGVGEALAGDAPGVLPLQAVVIDEQAHQLGDRDDRVRVVELEDDPLGQVAYVEVGGLGVLDEVVQAARDEEVLLLKSQLLALRSGVLGVEHLGDVLGEGLAAHRLRIVAGVENVEVEGPCRPGAPQAQGVDDAVLVAGDHVVVTDAEDVPAVDPLDAVAACLVDIPFRMPAEVHRDFHLRVRDLPGVAHREPVVRDLDLAAVDEGLLEDAVFVAQAIADAGGAHGRHRVDEASSQAA